MFQTETTVQRGSAKRRNDTGGLGDQPRIIPSLASKSTQLGTLSKDVERRVSEAPAELATHWFGRSLTLPSNELVGQIPEFLRIRLLHASVHRFGNNKGVYLFNHVSIELHMHRLDGLNHLFGTFSTQQSDADSGFGQSPRNHQLSYCAIQFVG